MNRQNDMIKKLVELKVQPYETSHIDFECLVPVEVIKKLYALGVSADYLLFVSVCNLKCYFEDDTIIYTTNESDTIIGELYTTTGDISLKSGFLIIGETLDDIKIALKCEGEQSKVYLIDSENNKILIAKSFKEFILNSTADIPDTNDVKPVQVTVTTPMSKELEDSLKEFKAGELKKSKKREAIKEAIIAGFFEREKLFNEFMEENKLLLDRKLEEPQQDPQQYEGDMLVEREEYGLYSSLMTELPVEQIKTIANPKRFMLKVSDNNEAVYRYEWDDLIIELKKMHADKIKEHVNGFKGYVLYKLREKNIRFDRELEQRIMNTSLVLGVSVEPGRDKEGRVEDVIGAILYNAHGLMFFKGYVYDENGDLII